MKAKKVLIKRKGAPDVIDIVEYEVPEPKDNEVRIKAAYAGLAFADIMLRKVNLPGLPKPPFTPGGDLAGVVEKVGRRVSKQKIGDRVIALPMSDFGGQAQYVCVDGEKVFKVPESVPLEKALCLSINYLTAYRMLTEVENASANVSKILVHGGSGGVGSALIQLAISRKIGVTATTSAANSDFVRQLGETAVDYRQEDFEKIAIDAGKVDAVFDPIGGSYLRRSVGVLKSGGRYVAFGFQSDLKAGLWGVFKSAARFSTAKLLSRDKRLTMFQLRQTRTSDFTEDLGRLFDLYRSGQIDPMISEVVPFQEARRAHQSLEQGNRRGKIIIAM